MDSPENHRLMITPENYKWRTGRKLGRTIYAMIDTQKESDDDILIGMMDTVHCAQLIVREHNESFNVKHS